MPKPYKVTVNGTYDFELSEKDLESLDILKTSTSRYHVLKENEPFPSEVLSSDFNGKTYRIKVRNDIYEVRLQNELDQQISRMGFSLGSVKNITAISAPMPGLILEIRVREGDQVAEDAPLLILEAMKMENVITSPREGVIESISVKVGESVDKKQLLITYA
ncbi:acetyl-CoA carboxylase biotin carboxyl carrier protein subunit [Muriicola jejuensis]|uniref:Acetyl-CoA carboxylase biotin carboxyl carrier protein subunit n=1 Tax=Muriicola jejuensis TaxID=504488 RepID=A0A6P0UGC0_9FLAO|nr:acetyl-CoA carboxylase biotin carboxyl carrier protein subunit [Muriicola jejuensis]NER10838.1 acetyl-CoA carboxylase biotin carboxyl carrier protein subunit [Muriicola jejuensis]